MNRTTRISLGLVVLVATSAEAGALPVTQSLTGVVKENPTKSPLEGVSVIATDSTEAERARTVSESDGSYVLEKLPAGTELKVEYRLVGYLRFPETARAVLGEGETKVLADVVLIDENVPEEKARDLAVLLLTSEDRAAELEWLRSISFAPEARARIDNAVSSEATLRGYFTEIYFDFNSFSLTPEARQSLARSAELLQQLPLSVTIEAHDDGQRSSEEAMALAHRRATEVQDQLVALGVPASRIQTISYGEEQPLCSESTETCWQSNRRAHFSLSLGRR